MTPKRWPPELRRVTVPAGVSGLWAVQRCKHGMLLACNGHVVMMDVPFEMETHCQPVVEAKRRTRHGKIDVLINGLGLGLIVQAMLSIRGVRRITVLEKSSDVIALVAPHYANPRLSIIHADAYYWEPPAETRYGVVWHDVWPSIHPDNLVGIACLERIYDGLCDWQGSWCRAEAEARATSE